MFKHILKPKVKSVAAPNSKKSQSKSYALINSPSNSAKNSKKSNDTMSDASVNQPEQVDEPVQGSDDKGKDKQKSSSTN